MATKRRSLIAWDMCGGRGHVVHLAAVARALRHRGFGLSARLLDLGDAPEIAPFCDSVEAVGSLPLRAAADQPFPSSHFGDLLGLHGFMDPTVIRGAIARWRHVISHERPAVVVCGLSPCAILAARSLDVPVVQVGVPCDTPPEHLPTFPGYSDGAPPALYDEKVLLDAVNDALSAFDSPPLPSLPAILSCDDQVTASLPVLDCFGQWRRRPLVTPVIGDWNEPGERRSQEVFIYLSTLERFNPVILTALATLGLPARVVVAGNLASARAILQRGQIAVETSPLLPGEIARRARILVHGGNHGMSCLGLRAGLPQVALAANPEHVFDARQLASLGVAIPVEFRHWSVPRIHSAIREAWESRLLLHRAREVAQDLATDFAGDSGDMTADRIEAVLG
jgi:UDP:flavonoid glycosyltransferase YjiC (YdhE family)